MKGALPSSTLQGRRKAKETRARENAAVRVRVRVRDHAAMVVDAGTLHLSNSDSSKSSLYVAIDLKR